MFPEAPLKFGQQAAGLLLPTVCFDQPRTVLAMDAALPVNALFVSRPRRVAAPVEREVLDVDVVVWQVEIRLILSMSRIRRMERVRRLVFCPDTVECEEVGDHELFVALDQIAVQRPQLDAARVAAIFGEVAEIERRTIGLPVVRNEVQQLVRIAASAEHLVEDSIKLLAAEMPVGRHPRDSGGR